LDCRPKWEIAIDQVKRAAATLRGQPLDDAAGNILGLPDVTIASGDPQTIEINANFVPLGTTVEIRVTTPNGAHFAVISSPLSGTFEASTGRAQVTFPSGDCHVTLRASF